MANGPGYDELQKITKELEKQAELKAKISKLQGDDVSKLDLEIQKLNARTAITVEQIALLEEDEVIRKSLIKSQQQQLANDFQRKRISKEAFDQKKDYLKEIAKFDDAEAKALAKKLESQQELTVKQRERLALQKGGVAATGAIAANLAQSLGFGKGLTHQLVKGLGANMKLKDSFGAISESLGSSFGPSGIIAFAITNTLQMALGLDSAAANFGKVTGASGDFKNVIAGAFKETSSFGTSLEEASESASQLYVNYNSFSNLLESSQKSLVASATALQKIGMNAQTTGEILNFLEYSLGMTGEELESFPNRLARTAVGLGLAPSLLQNQYANLIPKLALFGDKGEKIFGKVSKSAKEMGFDMKSGASDLFAMVDGLQDFESAADKVATLNLVLGGSFINTFDLVMAASEGPQAQLKMLQDAFTASGRSMDNMGFYEKKLLADQMGMSFDKLQKLMRGEITEEEAMMSSQEELTGAINKSVKMADKLMASIKRLAGPFVKLLKALTPIVEGFASFVEKGGGTLLLYAGMASMAGKLAIAMKGVGTSFAAAGTKAAAAGAAMRGAGLVGLAGMLGMGVDSIMESLGVSKDNRYLTGGLATAAGAAMMLVPGAQVHGGMLMAGGLTSMYNTSTSQAPAAPAASRQSGGRVTKTHSGELMTINAPGSGAEVFSQKAMTNYTNALRDHTKAVSSTSGDKGMSEMSKVLKDIRQILEADASTSPMTSVALYLDRNGTNAIAKQTVNTIKRNYNPDGSGRMST
jgi:hypothetical protein